MAVPDFCPCSEVKSLGRSQGRIFNVCLERRTLLGIQYLTQAQGSNLSEFADLNSDNNDQYSNARSYLSNLGGLLLQDLVQV